MRKWTFAVIGLFVVAAIAGCTRNVPVEGGPVTESSAPPLSDEERVPASAREMGHAFFTAKCMACHTVGGGRLVGPDLIDVIQRRERDWLMSWIEDPIGMGQNDPIGQQLLVEWNNVPMPPPGLTETEIGQILEYIAYTNNEINGTPLPDWVEVVVDDPAPGEGTGDGVQVPEGTGTPVDDSGIAADDTVVPADDAVVPADDAVVPADDALVPADDAVVPADDAVVPADDALVPADDAVVPADDALVPADDAAAPADDAVAPADDAVAPADEAAVPADDAAAPADNAVVPADDAAAPATH